MKKEQSKILFICSGNNKFGVAPFIKSQADGLKDEGLQVEFFTVKGGGLLSYIKAAFRLRKFLKTNSFDILHAHYGYSGWSAVLSFSGLPVVVSLMGSDVYGTFHEATLKNKNKKNFTDYVSIITTRILLNFVDFIIVKSPNLHSYIPKRFGPICEVIPNGVNFEEFKPLDRSISRNQLGFGLDQILVLFLGDPKIIRKNIKLANAAMEILKKDFPSASLVAPYPVPHEKIPIYMNAANLLLLPSFEEGSPNVVKECLACNVPVVCTNVGDVLDHVSKLDHSFVVEFSPEDVAQKMKRSIDLNNQSIENSREKISYLNRRVISERLIHIYNKVKP